MNPKGKKQSKRIDILRQKPHQNKDKQIFDS